MGCIHQQFGSSKCSLFNEGIENAGWDENGMCICSDDEDPFDSCEDYDNGDTEDDVEEEDFCDCDEVYDSDCCGDCCNDTKEDNIGGNEDGI